MAATTDSHSDRGNGLTAAKVVIGTMMVCNLFGCAGGAAFFPRIAKPGVVSGHERCPDGDCRTPSKALCQAKGFEDGTAIDTQTEYCFEKGVRLSSSCVFVTHARLSIGRHQRSLWQQMFVPSVAS